MEEPLKQFQLNTSDGVTNVTSSFKVDVAVGIKGNGTSDNDHILVDNVNLNLDGGDGIDAVLYQNTSDEYSLKVENNVVTVSNGGDKDTFTNIERIQFLDSNLAVDLDGNAGDAARFLGILLGKESVSNQNFAGIVIDFLDRGVSYNELMQIGLDAVLGPGASGASVVDLIYKNLVGSSAPEILYSLNMGR